MSVSVFLRLIFASCQFLHIRRKKKTFIIHCDETIAHCVDVRKSLCTPPINHDWNHFFFSWFVYIVKFWLFISCNWMKFGVIEYWIGLGLCKKKKISVSSGIVNSSGQSCCDCTLNVGPDTTATEIVAVSL